MGLAGTRPPHTSAPLVDWAAPGPSCPDVGDGLLGASGLPAPQSTSHWD